MTRARDGRAALRSHPDSGSEGKSPFPEYGAATQHRPTEIMGLAIHLAAVPDAVDTDDANYVSNLVNHTVIVDTDTPVVLASSQFAATRWAWVCRKGSDRRNNAVVDVGGEP